MKDDNYNGWTNYETWNVALWIGNDEKLYKISLHCNDYDDWLSYMRTIGSVMTGDQIRWNDSKVNQQEITEMFQEL